MLSCGLRFVAVDVTAEFWTKKSSRVYGMTTLWILGSCLWREGKAVSRRMPYFPHAKSSWNYLLPLEKVSCLESKLLKIIHKHTSVVLSCWYQTILTTLYHTGLLGNDCWSHDKHCIWNENQRVKGKVKKCLIPQIVQLKKLLKVTALMMKRKIVFCELLQHVNQIKIVNKLPLKTMKR